MKDIDKPIKTQERMQVFSTYCGCIAVTIEEYEAGNVSLRESKGKISRWIRQIGTGVISNLTLEDQFPEIYSLMKKRCDAAYGLGFFDYRTGNRKL